MLYPKWLTKVSSWFIWESNPWPTGRLWSFFSWAFDAKHWSELIWRSKPHLELIISHSALQNMIGVNSLHSAGRFRSRSLCSVRYGRDFRMMDPFRYPRTPRSRSLKPLVFPDLLGKAQDAQNHRTGPQEEGNLVSCTYLFITHLVICTCSPVAAQKGKTLHRWTMQPLLIRYSSDFFL